MHQKTRLVSLSLLLLALAAPVLFLAGYVIHGAEILSRPMSCLVVGLFGLGLGAAAAMYLALRRDALVVRLVAALSLVVLIASLIYVRIEWGQSMSRVIEQLRREPFDANEVGVLICPADHSGAASREANDLQELIERTVAGAGLESTIKVQLAQPIWGADQARVLAQDRRASLVVWKEAETYHGRVTERYTVGAYGVAHKSIAAEPVDLMLVLLTDETLDLERVYEQGEGGLWPLAREVVAPFTIGMALWPAGEPLLAATLLDKAAASDGLRPREQQALHEFQAVAMLALGRPDLASEQLAMAQGIDVSARSTAIEGTIAMARREWDDAERHFMRGVSLDPTYQPAYCGLSSVLATKLDATRSIQAAQQAIALDRDKAAPYAFLGMALERSGDISAASAAYQQAAVLSGGNLGLYSAAAVRIQALRVNPPTPVPTATIRPTPSITPYPTVALHEVAQGETLAIIAERYGVTIDAIIEINDISNRNAIAAGDRLRIPASLD